jgi:hypothetical protein
MNFISYLRIFIVGLLLLTGITGGVFSVHSCLMSAAESECAVSAVNDCCCSDEPATEKTSAQSDASCCKTTSAYFNIPVYGVVKLIDINPVLIQCFFSSVSVRSLSEIVSSVSAFNSDDPPDKIAGSDILIRIEKFLI